MSGADLKAYYRHSPKISKAWLTLLIMFPLAGKFGVISEECMFLGNTIEKSVFLNYEPLTSGKELWRIFTCAFYYPVSLTTLVHYLTVLYFNFFYSCQLELTVFRGRQCSYLLFLLFSFVSSVLMTFLTHQKLAFDASMFLPLNLWCLLNKDQTYYLWLGYRCTARRFMWLMLAAQVVLEWKFAGGLIGICVSHLYYKLNKKALGVPPPTIREVNKIYAGSVEKVKVKEAN